MINLKISEEQIADILQARQEIQDKYEKILEDCQAKWLSHFKQSQVTHAKGVETGMNLVLFILDIDPNSVRELNEDGGDS